MSDEISSPTGGTVMQARSSTEFHLSSADEELIEMFQENPTSLSRETTVDTLANLSVKNSRQLDHSRVVLNKAETGYALSMYDESLDTYNRDYLQSVFLNGVPIEIKSDGLELEDVAIYVYLTSDEQYVASIWT